ncbi:MAG: 3-phosphoglycerate dehydrogenase [Firmicutes bacterium]|jgi:D-3-phosphoglycerate dehydrogenase|nr:3-phosphoglycerate dehydrogenase [Bacillota bacterium]
MFKISTLNKISKKGLNLLDDKYIITEKTEDADGILVRSQDMHSMELSSDLRAIARAGAGVNNIPLDKCAEKGIVVFNTPGANANAVKELVIAGLFLASRNIPKALTWAASLSEDVSKTVEKGKSQFAGSEISGKTLGVVGLGAIGRKVAASAAALGMNVAGYDPYYSGGMDTITICNSIEELLPQCDYITIHVPATDSTKGMFNKELFAIMKDSAVLLNFSRDKLVNDVDLLIALETGALAAYVTDFPNDALVGRDKVILLPHLGASTEEAEENCAVMVVEQMMNYFENGNIINSVNFPKVDMGPLEKGVRLAFFTKDCDDPVVLVQEQLIKCDIKAAKIQGANKGKYGYVLVEADLDTAPSIVFYDSKIIKHVTFK